MLVSEAAANCTHMLNLFGWVGQATPGVSHTWPRLFVEVE